MQRDYVADFMAKDRSELRLGNLGTPTCSADDDLTVGEAAGKQALAVDDVKRNSTFV